MPTLIPLSQGMFATVDDADAEWLSQWRWTALKHNRNDFAYAFRKQPIEGGRRKTIMMHRQILAAPDGICVDHVNGDGLMNCRSNLRLATYSQNMQNRRMHRNNTSGFKGVSMNKCGRFFSRIMFQKTTINLGTFDTAEEAHAAYVAAALELHGEFARAS